MRKLLVIALGILLFSCGTPEEEATGTLSSANTETLVGSDSIIVAQDYDIESQPTIVQQFFKFKDTQIGADYCYDDNAVKALLIEGVKDEFTWTNYLIKDDYLRFENQECFVTTELKIIGDEETRIGVLLQTSKNSQQVGIYKWLENEQYWKEYKNPPKPKLWNFYSSLEDPEQVWVDEFGYYYTYVRENTDQISFEFSTWQMGLNMDGKEINEFNKEPDYSFDLMFDQKDGFWLKRNYEDKSKIPKRYFLAYSEDGETTEDYSWILEGVKNGLADYKVETTYADLTESNYQAVFSTRTFDLGSMPQFAPRDGFWFYEEGKEPLDLEYDLVEVILPQAKRYFDEYFSF